MIRCPVCQSTEIYEVAGGCLGQVYRCKACGYRGSFVLEIDDEGSGKPGDAPPQS
jgi:transposase-like protein